MTKNMVTMVSALGGDATALGALDSSLVFDGQSPAEGLSGSYLLD
jgi:hypothetical protein